MIQIGPKLATTGQNPGSRRSPSEQRGKDIEEHWHSAIPVQPWADDDQLSHAAGHAARKSRALLFKTNTDGFRLWFAGTCRAFRGSRPSSPCKNIELAIPATHP
jgi:hypothetical protein